MTRGFTLVELLVVMAISALLAAMAWPQYRHTMQRARRTEARIALLEIRVLQERHYIEHEAYASRIDAPAGAGGLGAAILSPNRLYELDLLTAADGQHYVATARAAPDGTQAGDAPCQRFSIDAVGVRRAASAGGDWQDAARGGCWG